MERPFEFIADITDKKDMWKLAVRVKEKWTVVKDGKEHVEMIIVDAKGTDVQVLIPTDYKAAYDKILEVNATYSLSNFQVVINKLVFKASEHKFLLKWTGGTTAVDVNVHPIPAAPTKFKSFAEIISGKWKPDILVNVIGVVQDMGYCQLTQGNGKKLQVNFTIRDLSDIVLNCTLWEDYAAKFIQYNSNRKEGGPVIVMMQYCKIKAEGRYALSVSNTYTYTRLFINDNITEINNFRGSLPKDDMSQSQSQILCTQSYSSSQLSSEEDFLSNSMILPIANIIQLDQISYYVTVATIEKVNSTKHGWYYFSCHKCPKIAKGDNPPYTCDDGHNTETEIVRYKLEMTVSYAEEKTTFVFWDREVTQLLGIAASQLRANMIQAGITNRFEYPLMMDGLSGKSIVAKVKWQPKWKTCSVVCFKDGSPSPFVDKVISKFPHYQLPAPQNVQDGQADDMVADQHVQENDVTLSNPQLSASSEYDPEISTQITPLSKLQNVDQCKDLESLSQLRTTNFQDVDETAPVHQLPNAVITEAGSHAETNPAKQSSSKRVKLIKQEKK